MFVSFGMVVAIIEAAETVEVFSAIFAQGFDEGEADVEPVLVVGGDVDARGFDLLDKSFDVSIEVV